MDSILVEGTNCWRIEKASRAAILVDGENYYPALHAALCNAQKTIFIVGWDLHSELELVRDDQHHDFPIQLGALLDALAKERPELNIYILNWDFSMVYAMEREFFPRYKLRWRTHKRVHFCLDGSHSLGASHHQKVVVVDDAVAFCGGFDLSKWRWDTRSHRADEPLRTDPDGESYPPFHDVQMLVEGDAAAALGQLARERWRNAGACETQAPPQSAPGDAWPTAVSADFYDTEIAIARTASAYGERQAVREIEQLYLDMIAAAQRFIYIENQYLSSHAIGQALVERLGEAQGPEVLVVMPRETGGWLEQHTMDVLRARLLRELREADHHDRLRLYYPRVSSDPEVAVMVHAKVMVVDDELVRVASSNLSNRSMGLDTECDLLIQAGDSADRRQAIRAFRRSLLAEHLGVEADDVVRAESQHQSLIKAVESLRDGVHTLQPLSPDLSEEVDEWVPESELIDPEAPVEPEDLYNYFAGSGQHGRAYHHGLRVAVLLAAVLGLAAAWRWTPLSDWLSMDRVEAAAQWIEDSPFTPLLVLLAYVLGSIVVLPVTLMIIATVTVFGPWWGFVYAMVGAQLAAMVTYGIGHMIGGDAISRIAGSQLNSVRRALSRRGIATVVTLRIVPVAPFTVINLIAGISEIRFRDFAIGSLLGLLPGVTSIAFLADRIAASVRDPSATSIAILAVAVVAVGLFLYGLRRWTQRKRRAAGS
tara:strand:- start:70665 stop:72788 length:2124 start_codon:yes stop_codon:yes gene_type:complete